MRIAILCAVAALVFFALAWRSVGREEPTPPPTRHCAHCGELTVLDLTYGFDVHAVTGSVTCAPYDERRAR